MKREDEYPLEDGFESDDDAPIELLCKQVEKPREEKIHVEGHMIKYIPPPQEIKARTYSLHPDIITGWAPKIPMPKPDDELSEGKSDSQNADDDIDAAALKSLLSGQTRPVKKLQMIRATQQKRQNNQTKLSSIIQNASFITDVLEDREDKEKRGSPIQRRRKQTLIRKKLYTVSGLPSPSKDQDNTSAKIINLRFLLNPIPVARERRQKQRTQHGVWQQQKQIIQQPFESYRRTYLSLQKQALKKQMIKRISMYDRPMRQNQTFKMQEIVGKRLFTQT